MVYQNDDPLYNPPFSFDNDTRTLTIESYSDSSITGIHSLKYIVTNNHGGATLEDDFEVEIKCDIESSYGGQYNFDY